MKNPSDLFNALVLQHGGAELSQDKVAELAKFAFMCERELAKAQRADRDAYATRAFESRVAVADTEENRLLALKVFVRDAIGCPEYRPEVHIHQNSDGRRVGIVTAAGMQITNIEQAFDPETWRHFIDFNRACAFGESIE